MLGTLEKTTAEMAGYNNRVELLTPPSNMTVLNENKL